jgi:uncharacterized protein (DUF1800 family)
VSNNSSYNEVFEVRSDEKVVTSSDISNNQKRSIWTEIGMRSNDQLRQRMAWALAQIITVVPINIDAYDRTEAYTIYYDIFVRHAFGNFREILSEISYSPLMAEHLSCLKSKSHAYVYNSENKRVSSADENVSNNITVSSVVSIPISQFHFNLRLIICTSTANRHMFALSRQFAREIISYLL